MTGSPFVWNGLNALSYEELEALQKRKMQGGKTDTSPVRSWTQGMARVAESLVEGLEARQASSAFKDAQAADAANLSSVLALPPITGGPVPGEPVPGVPSDTKVLPNEAGGAASNQTFASVAPRLTADLSRDLQLEPEKAAGVVGQLAAESGGFKQLQELNPTVPGSRGGAGYAQWTGPRRREFESFTASNGLDPKSYEGNYAFLKHELTNTPEGRVVEALRRAPDAMTAGRAFTDGFLRPGKPNYKGRDEWTRRTLNTIAGGEGGSVRGGTGADTLAPPVAMNDEEAAALEAKMGGGMVVPPVPVANNDAEAAALEAKMGGGMVVPPQGMPKLAPPVLAPAIPGESALPPGLQGLPQTAPLPPVRPEGLGAPIAPTPNAPITPTGPGSAVPPAAVARVAAAMGGAPVPGSPAYEAMSNPDLSPTAVAALSSPNRNAMMANLVASSPQAQPVPASANYASMTGRSGAPAPLPERVNVPVPAAAPAAPGPATVAPPPAAAIPGNAPPSVQRVAQAAQQAMPPELLRAMTDPRSSPATKAVAGAIYRQRAEEIQTQQRQIYETLSKREQRGYDEKKTQEERAWKEAQEAKKKDAIIEQYNYAKTPEGGGFTGSLVDFKKSGANNVNVNTGENAFGKEANQIQAKRYGGLVEQADTAAASRGEVDSLAALLEGIGTNAGTETRLGLAQAAKAVGLDGVADGLTGGKMSEMEGAKALIDRMVPRMRVPGSGTTSDRDLALFKSSMLSLGNQPGGNKIIADTVRSLADYQVSMGDIAGQALRQEITQSEADKMLREIPSPFEGFKAFQKEAAKNAPASGAAPAPAAPAAAPAPPVKGDTRKGPDGATWDFIGGDPASPSSWRKRAGA